MLSSIVDKLDNLITNQRLISEIKPHLGMLRDQCDALEREHSELAGSHEALKTAHAAFQITHSSFKQETADAEAKLKREHAAEIARMAEERAKAIENHKRAPLAPEDDTDGAFG